MVSEWKTTFQMVPGVMVTVVLSLPFSSRSVVREAPSRMPPVKLVAEPSLV